MAHVGCDSAKDEQGLSRCIRQPCPPPTISATVPRQELPSFTVTSRLQPIFAPSLPPVYRLRRYPPCSAYLSFFCSRILQHPSTLSRGTVTLSRGILLVRAFAVMRSPQTLQLPVRCIRSFVAMQDMSKLQPTCFGGDFYIEAPIGRGSFGT